MQRLLVGALFLAAACSSAPPSPSEPSDLAPIMQQMKTQLPDGGSVEMQGNTIHTRDANGKLVAITLLKRKDGVITSVETTILGPNGAAIFKSEQKPTKENRISFFDKACSLFLPTKLYAADLPCLRELATMASTNIILSVAIFSLTGAYTTCAAGVVATCATIPLLQAGVAAAVLANGVAIADFTNCMNKTKQTQVPIPPPAGAGGGTGGTVVTCYLVTYYVSYDGGFSWSQAFQEVHCS